MFNRRICTNLLVSFLCLLQLRGQATASPRARTVHAPVAANDSASVTASIPSYFQTGVLDFQSRVWAQTQVERVFYNHRIWPNENPGPKPPFERMMPQAAIEGKVREMLRQNAALRERWNTEITSAMLQAEMDRIMTHTRDAATLKELIEGLHGDAFLLAETLARDNEITRLIHDRFSQDREIHAAVRENAERALRRADSPDWSGLGGVRLRQTIVLGKRSQAGSEPERPEEQYLDEAAFQRKRDNTADTASPAKFTENPDGFLLLRTVVKTPARIVTERLLFRKRQFDDWWMEYSHQWTAADSGNQSRSDVQHSAYKLHEIKRPDAAVCDDWQTPANFNGGTPSARINHTAVWTGVEMIVWGGGGDNTGGRYNPVLDLWSGTSTNANVPSARQYHSAIWTGSVMIVWGGSDGGSALYNSGGRYDPVVNSWLTTSTGINSPDARYWHTAVWSGSEMIIWGGAGGAQPGGRYNPLSDTWLQISKKGMPTVRSQHTAIWTGTEMIIWGGSGGGATGGRYDPANDSWTPTSVGANLPSPRSLHTAVWTGTEMIVFGGVGGGGTGGRYDPAADSWLTMTPLALPLLYQSAVWTGTEMIIWGGYYQALNESEKAGARYHPLTDSWTFVTNSYSLPVARDKHTAVWTGTEMIVWGGETISGCPMYCSTYNNNSGGRYNPASDSWVPTSIDTSVPSSRENHASIWTGNEMIVWGGYGGFYLNSGGRYTPALDNWVSTTSVSAPSGRTRPTAVWSGSEMIVWGGFARICPSTTCYYDYKNTGGRYNPSSDLWISTSTAGSVPTGRMRHTAVWTGTEMIVWGGTAGNSGGRYAPGTDSWLPTSMGTNVPAGRQSHTVVWTGSEMIVWGGYINVAPYYTNSGGRYNPITDSWLPTSIGTNVPGGRDSHTAVWTGSEMIVWGGTIYTTQYDYLNTGARYNPQLDSWQKTSEGLNLPDARALHAAIWTGNEMIVWGGGFGATYLATGGRYNPAADAWLPTSTTSGVPSARANHTAVWTGNEMIVWGGSNQEYLSSGGVYRSPYPSFAGLQTAVNSSLATCTVQLGWSPAQLPCTPNATYNIYRSTVPAFLPQPAYRIAGGVSGTSYADTAGLANGVNYFYAVRAADSTGVEDGNSQIRGVVPSGPLMSGNFTDTFEGAQSGGGFDNAGWTHTALSGAANWIWSSAQAKSPSHSWYSQSQPAASDRVLVSPAYKMAATSALSFWHTYSFQNPPLNPLCQDAGTLEISTDGGATWTTPPAVAFTVGGLNGTVDSTSNPLYGKEAWCGGTIGAMTQVNVNLSAYAGLTAQFRWHAGDDAAVVKPGWYVDSVTFNNVTSNSSCNPGACPASAMAPISGIHSGNDLSWSWPAAFGGNNYRVYRASVPNPGGWGAPLASQPADTLTWSDFGQAGLPGNRFYTVTDVNFCGIESPQ